MQDQSTAAQQNHNDRREAAYRRCVTACQSLRRRHTTIALELQCRAAEYRNAAMRPLSTYYVEQLEQLANAIERI
jgi:hypothetical protein